MVKLRIVITEDNSNHKGLLSRVLSELNGGPSVNINNQTFTSGYQQDIAVVISAAVSRVQIAVIYFNNLLSAK